MNQMVLPQTPPSNEPGHLSKQPDRAKSGDSQFDEVSRAEEKRLARKQADRQQGQKESARPAEQGSAQKTENASGRPAGNDRSEATDAASRKDTDDTDAPEQQPTAQVTELQTTELAEQPLLFSFGLPQPLSGKGPTDAPSGGGIPATGNLLPGAGVGSMGEGANGMVKSMLMMALGKTDEAPGKTASLQFADLMPAQGEQALSRIPDPSALVSGQRLNAAPDLSPQQQMALNGRIPGEPVPLKGYTTSVEVPVGQAEWGDKVMGKLTWLTANKMSVAEIHLTPPDMGPMEVRVQVQQDQTSITVHAANPVVRDQLELHSHRLRDMLGEQGLNLEKFDVADSAQQQTGEQASSGEDSGASGEHDTRRVSVDTGPGTDEVAAVDLTHKGEVDIFA
ncbi:MAG: flagellar hook-length control protein FliK [Pseudomonadota bacterium]|nr:flagellar hook-length control protein FliK [Pseudomonadota bacterium]